MIIGYKKQFPWGLPTCFKGKIIDGIKKTTIREDKYNRWFAGRLMQHCHGVRTKFFEMFLINTCKSVQKIEIIYNSGAIFIKIDDQPFYDSVKFSYKNQSNILMLASNDGFDSVQDFFRYFDKDFKGKIIHWTDLRY